MNRAEMEKAMVVRGDRWHEGVLQQFNERSEVYTVREAVWKEAGIEPMGGCLCIGCREKRIERRLRPKDFQRNHPFNGLPGTARLLMRQGRAIGGR